MSPLFATLAFLVCIAVGGAALTAKLCELDEGETGPLETVAAWAVVTLFYWVSLNWVLAPFRAIAPAFLVAPAVLVAAAGVPTLRRALVSGALKRGIDRVAGSLHGVERMLVLLPLLVWIAFALARGAITPALGHDALSYHLPRAIDIARTGTWRYLPTQDTRLAWFPSSYEMLLADIVVLSKGDQATSLVGVITYGAGIVVAAAFGERRWGTGRLAWLTAVVWAGTPLALLHSVHHKNDTLIFVAIAATAMWAARWVARGGVFPLVLATLSAALAIGVKLTGLLIVPAAALAFAPFGLLTRLRAAMRQPRALVAWLAGALLAVMLAGIAPYAAHVIHLHSPRLVLQPDDPRAFAMNIFPRFGSWTNVPEFLALVLLEPFSRRDAVWVPWRHADWFWPRHELYFSGYGALVSLLALAIPVGLFWRRRWPADAPWRREARGAALFLLAIAVAILPGTYRLVGFFCGDGRYLLFLPILIVEWGLGSLLASRGTREKRWQRIGASSALVVAVGFFAWSAYDDGVHDAFAPADYLVELFRDPTSRRPYFSAEDHPTFRVDLVAKPGDRILVDGGFGAWLWPAYGKGLTRPVEILAPPGPERDAQIARADWVVIDHYWGAAWGAKELDDMSKVSAFVNHGTPDPREYAFAERMKMAPGFTLFYERASFCQFIFRRE